VEKKFPDSKFPPKKKGKPFQNIEGRMKEISRSGG
jgi:hypothetical protein